MPFGPITLGFDEGVLRPRPWTIEQSAWAAELSAGTGPIAELCAGAGQIGLALAWMTARDLVLVDADGHACAHARANADRSRLQADVRSGSIDELVRADERFAIIVADPPWVPSGRTSEFPDDPRTAIDGGPDGLDIARRCVDVIGAHLTPGGVAVLQLGTWTQANGIHAYAQARPGGVRVVDVREPTGNGMLVQLRRATSEQG